MDRVSLVSRSHRRPSFRTEKNRPVSASQWTGLHCILRRYAASTTGVEGMEKEREKEPARLGVRRAYSPCRLKPHRSLRPEGRAFFLALPRSLGVPGEPEDPHDLTFGRQPTEGSATRSRRDYVTSDLLLIAIGRRRTEERETAV